MYRPKIPGVKLFYSEESYKHFEEKINNWFLNNPMIDLVDTKFSITSTPDGTLATSVLVMYEKQDDE